MPVRLIKANDQIGAKGDWSNWREFNQLYTFQITWK